MAFNEKFVDHIVGNYKAPKDAIALDIGANRGMYTVKMAKKFDKVYAIEACPATCDTLRGRMKNESVPNVEVCNYAICDLNQDVHLFTQGGQDGKDRGGNTTSLRVANEKKWGHNPEKSIIVPGITLDSFIEEKKIDLKKLRFIKMDIEGGEDFAWLGAHDTLTNGYLDIVLEVHNCVDYARLHKYFKDHGYKTLDANAKEVNGFTADTHYLVTNRA